MAYCLVVIPNFITAFGSRSIGSVLHGDMRVRLRIIRQTCSEMGVFREGRCRTITFICSCAAPGAVDGDAADQGALIPQNPDGVPGPAQTILQAVLGPWIFLDHIRQCD